MELADRYLDAVKSTCATLIDHPHGWHAIPNRQRPLKGLRRFPVSGFKSYLVFYLSDASGIDVIRILHGARDMDTIISQE